VFNKEVRDFFSAPSLGIQVTEEILSHFRVSPDSCMWVSKLKIEVVSIYETIDMDDCYK